MTYFRRPLLAGKTLVRTDYPTIRGSVRRSDPDGAPYNEPFFPGLASGQTLILGFNSEIAPVITFSSGAYLSALTAINAVLSQAGLGKAFDADGTIAIQSLAYGGNSTVDVLGGTGAKSLGFDLSAGPIRARGGDLPSAPEGRVGNVFGSAFPVEAEGLSTESVNRALGRLAANSDVLYSDMMRDQAALSLVGTLTDANVARLGGYSTYDVPDGVRIFAGFQDIIDPVSPELLSPFFSIIDTVTGLPISSQVVDIVKRGTVGVPPYPPALSADGNDTGSVVGVLLPRMTETAILSIKNGRVIELAGVGNAQVGDYVTINGSDSTINKSPWDNRGAKWVVEEVLDASHLALRPMSRVEQGYSSYDLEGESQPVVELNGTLLQGQNYGNVDIIAGQFVSGCSLVFYPPIPPGTNASLYAAVPASQCSKSVFSDLEAHRLAKSSTLSRAGAPSPNAVLSRPSLSITPATLSSGGNVLVPANLVVGSFGVRWHGRFVRVPAASVTVPQPGAYNQKLYWDETDCLVHLSTTVPSTGHLLGYTANATTVASACLTDSRPGRAASVGVGGNFSTLLEATSYANMTGLPMQLVLLEDQTAASPTGWLLLVNLTVRGIHPGIAVNVSAPGGKLFTAVSSTIVLEDVVLDTQASGDDSSLFSLGPTARVKLKNIGGPYPRTLAAVGSTVDVGAGASRTVLRGTLVEVVSPLAVDSSVSVFGTATFAGDLVATAGATTIGHLDVTLAANTNGIKMWSDGQYPHLQFYKAGEGPVELTKGAVGVLTGGAASNADSLHTHSFPIQGLTNHLANTLGAHKASAVSVLSGGFHGKLTAAATDVQYALAALDIHQHTKSEVSDFAHAHYVGDLYQDIGMQVPLQTAIDAIADKVPLTYLRSDVTPTHDVFTYLPPSNTKTRVGTSGVVYDPSTLPSVGVTLPFSMSPDRRGNDLPTCMIRFGASHGFFTQAVTGLMLRWWLLLDGALLLSDAGYPYSDDTGNGADQGYFCGTLVGPAASSPIITPIIPMPAAGARTGAGYTARGAQGGTWLAYSSGQDYLVYGSNGATAVYPYFEWIGTIPNGQHWLDFRYAYYDIYPTQGGFLDQQAKTGYVDLWHKSAFFHITQSIPYYTPTPVPAHTFY
jgi:hypothetical protein